MVCNSQFDDGLFSLHTPSLPLVSINEQNVYDLTQTHPKPLKKHVHLKIGQFFYINVKITTYLYLYLQSLNLTAAISEPVLFKQKGDVYFWCL